MSVAISFDGNDLQTANILTTGIDGLESYPEENDKMYALAHGNRSEIPFIEWTSKLITIEGTIIGDSIVDLDNRLDAFRAYFLGKDKHLDIAYGSSTRRYIAKALVRVNRPRFMTTAEFTIEFKCVRPFGQNVNPTTALNVAGRTLGTYTDPYTFLGTAPVMYPIRTITYTALTGGTDVAVTFGNNDNGQSATVQRDWTVGDIVVFNSDTEEVKVNGVLTNFTGAFPTFPAGAGNMVITDGFTTRTFNDDVIYYPMWI